MRGDSVETTFLAMPHNRAFCLAKGPYSPAEYLLRERDERNTERSEYVDGDIFPMASASYDHNLIVANVLFALKSATRGRDVDVLASNIRVRVGEPTRFYYPDCSLVLGLPAFYDSRSDTITNPALIVEVLSPSTEATDCNEKWEAYKSLPSLMTYLLVSQNLPRVEMWGRTDDSDWSPSPTVVDGLEASVDVGHLRIALPLKDIYDRVPFEED